MEKNEEGHRPEKLRKKEHRTADGDDKQKQQEHHKKKNVDLKQHKKHAAKKESGEPAKKGKTSSVKNKAGKTNKNSINKSSNNKKADKNGVAVHIHNLPFRLSKAELESFLIAKKIENVSIMHMERIPDDPANHTKTTSANKLKGPHWATYHVVVPSAAVAAAIVSLFNHHDYNKNPEEHYLFGRTAFPLLQHYFPSLLSATLMTGGNPKTSAKEKEEAVSEAKATGATDGADAEEAEVTSSHTAAAAAASVPATASANKKKNKFKTYKAHTALVIEDGAIPLAHKWRDIKSAIGHIISGNQNKEAKEKEEAHNLVKNGIELIKLCETSGDSGARTTATATATSATDEADGSAVADANDKNSNAAFYEKAFLICKSEEAKQQVLDLFQHLTNENTKFDTHVRYLKRARPSSDEEEQYIQQEIESWRSVK